MAQITTSTTNFTKMLVDLVEKRLQVELRSPLPHLLPGNFRPASFVKGTNNTMRFLHVSDMSVVAGTPNAGTPPWLTEGTSPTAEDLAIGYDEFSANQAGRTIQITDKALLQSPVDLIAVAAEKVARNAIATADLRVAEVLGAGTNVLYAGSATSSQTVDPRAAGLVGSLIKRAVASLEAGNVPKFGDGTYHCIVHPGPIMDLMSDTAAGGWIDASRYAKPEQMLTGEVGMYFGVKFIQSAASYKKLLTGTTVVGGNVTGVATTNVISTATAHGFAANDQVQFTALTGGAGLSINTVYFVIAAGLTSTAFEVSTTQGGSAVDFTTDITAGSVGKAGTVYSAIMFGPEAYAFGDWGQLSTHITPPGGQSDPLLQRAIVGWKGYFGAVLLDDPGVRYVRLETGTTL